MPSNLKKNNFFLLALSQNQVKLFECNSENISEVKINHLPKNLESITGTDYIEKQLQQHSGTGKGQKRKDEIFHGHGVGTNHHKDNIFHYFRAIDKALHEYLRDKRAPLVLATIDYLVPIYKKANTYQNLSEKFVHGNPDRIHQAQLYKKGLKLLFPLLEK